MKEHVDCNQTIPKSTKMAGEILFSAAKSTAQQLREAGWTWGEIEQICHFLMTIARVEGYAGRRA